MAALTVILAACASTDQWAPARRTASIATAGCGHASRTSGTGILVGDDRVLTAAHVVVGAATIEVAVDDRSVDSLIVVLDARRDLALLAVPDVDAPRVELGELQAGDHATIEGAVSGSLAADVLRRVAMSVDEVRGFERTTRLGYELAAPISGGDSGAGLYDGKGRLAGLVFAVPTDRDGVAWATRAEEFSALLEGVIPEKSYVCDSDESRVVPEDDPDST